MKVLEFFECDEGARRHWIEQIKKSDWRAARFLVELLTKDASGLPCLGSPSCEFFRWWGAGSKIFLLVEGDALLSFCSFAEKDDIPDCAFGPWIGFVYTFPQYRGKRRMGILFTHIFKAARSQGLKTIYISTHDEGIYEKYGFSFLKVMKDMGGEDSRIYKIDFEDKDYSGIIGKHVAGKIDRPLGSRHPRHPDMLYPVNYGYVEHVFAGDGAEQDVYLMGADAPLRDFSGKVIAVWHRLNDVEDKWIAVPDGNTQSFSDEEIEEAIFFTEQYYVGELWR